MDSNETVLNAHSWLSVITFLVVIAIVIRPVRIPLPIPVFKKQVSSTSITNDASDSIATFNNLSVHETPPTLSTANRSQVCCEAVTATQENVDNNSRSTNRPSSACQAKCDSVNSTSLAKNELESMTSVPLPPTNTVTCDNNITTRSDNEHNTTDIDILDDHLKRKITFPYHITLNIATAPVLGVLFLLATKSIHGQSVRDGIIGEPSSGVEPYAVMVLFFSLAYICISLDMTGVFQYAAFWISRRGGGGGQRIFLAFFLLSSIMSGLASNDVVILTMTPFLVYFSQAVELATPVAFLMAELQTANIASMLLYIGNLTNVVVCQAYKISFVEYSAWMFLPCVASIAACYMMLRLNFRHEKYIPKLIKVPLVEPRSCLKDPVGAVFGLAVLSSSLACLIGTSFVHVSVWMVTGPFAILVFARDVWYDVWRNRREQKKENGKANAATAAIDDNVGLEDIEMIRGLEAPAAGLPEIAAFDLRFVFPIQLHPSTFVEDRLKEPVPIQDNNISATIGETIIPLPITDRESIRSAVLSTRLSQNTLLGRFQSRFPLLYGIGIRMPWAILPFTFSMFIMVEGLSHSGWIAIFATWATRLVPNYIAATYVIGFISVVLCNLFNNVPMTILVARILQHPNFASSSLSIGRPEVVRGCVLALIVGSNLGACTTLISSLAGLMWDSVLRSKNSNVGFWNFFKWNMGVMPIVIFVALSVVIIELTAIY